MLGSGYGPPGFGSGLTDSEVYKETHKMRREEAAFGHRHKGGIDPSERKALHKLMQSGTTLGKVVKFFYRVIWDVSYR